MKNIGKLIFTIVPLALIIVQLFFQHQQLNTITVVLLALSILPWVSKYIESIAYKDIVVKTRDIERVVNQQNEQLNQQKNQVDTQQNLLEQQKTQIEILKLVIFHLLSDGERQILRKLSSSDQFIIDNSPFPDISADQFRDLLDRNFIERITPNTSFARLIDSIHKNQRVDVRNHVKIAPGGLKYLELLDQLPDLET
jgi:hypothetical protein